MLQPQRPDDDTPNRVPQPAPPARGGLSKDLRDFLAELSIGLHKFGMYPAGHPALVPVVASLITRAAVVTRGRGQLALGISPQQITVDGAATDPAHLASRRLAEGIHRHGFGAVVLRPGLEGAEIAATLAALAQDPTRVGALASRPASERPSWPHLRLHPTTTAIGPAFPGSGQTSTDDVASSHEGDGLWLRLACAAFTNSGLAAPSDRAFMEPSLIARALEARLHAHTCDQDVIGALSDIARELRLDSGPAITVLRQRMARLLRALGPTMLGRLILACGTRATQQTFLFDAVHGMATDTVIDIVTASADASDHTLSREPLAVLTKLAATAAHGTERARPLAEALLREQVEQMLGVWRLLVPASGWNGSGLVPLRADGPLSSAGAAIASPDPVRLVQMSLAGGWDGLKVEQAIDDAIAQGQAATLLRLVAGHTASAVHARPVRNHLLRPDRLSALLQNPDADDDSLHRLQCHAPAEHYRAALQALATTDDRGVRHRLLDRLARAPVDLGDLIVAQLEDPRWFVQRNMLALLERSGRTPDHFDVTPWIVHEDVRVRHQAIRLWLQHPSDRALAVRAALADGHPHMAHRALSSVQHDCPASLAEPVSRIALDPAADQDLRLLAAQALGRCHDAVALDALLSLTDGGRTLLGKPKLAPRSPLTLAGVRSLAVGWRSDPRADARVRLAEAAADADIRLAVEASHR